MDEMITMAPPPAFSIVGMVIRLNHTLLLMLDAMILSNNSSGIDAAEQISGVTVYHAGTKIDENGELVSAGGRVLNVTAVARDFPTAVENAYKAVELIEFDGAFFRHDIAHRALAARQPS